METLVVNDNNISFNELIFDITKYPIPYELIEEISTWYFIVKSPHSNSFYNSPVAWGYKPNGTMRISDHWNFFTNEAFHCVTTTPIPNNHWGIGIFNSNNGKYDLIKIVPPTKQVLGTVPEIQLLTLEHDKQRAIDKIKRKNINVEESIIKCEEGFIKRHQEILEKIKR